jgi:hypothetical protein
LQRFPVLQLPGRRIIEAHIAVFLPAVTPAGVPDGNIHHMFPLVRTYITTVAVGLFLVVILHFPNDLVLHHKPEGYDVGAVCGVEEDQW